jgi:[ribosomal protein S18]-alanine N-acetyltransferase
VTQIRTLTYPDLPRVLAIERRAFPTPWSLSMFVLELSRHDGICLAAIEPGTTDGESGTGDGESGTGDGDPEIAGFLICARYDEAYHLMNIAVDPDRRRHGIGRALIDGMLERAGLDANVTLEVRVSNIPAIALYESYGFRGVGTRRRYYSDTGEDAIIMWRAIGTPWV